MIPDDPFFQILGLTYTIALAAGVGLIVWAKWTTRHWKDRS